jgi:hypothetical protein
MTEPNQGKAKIAVIAVHGVADQPAHDSARAIASLLLNDNQSKPSDKQVQYTPFYESTLRIAVRPVNVSQEPPKLEPVHEESLTTIEDTLDMNAHKFIWEQVHQYKGKGVKSTYETIRLAGSRLGHGNQPQSDIHIYEMYWADLSRLGTGILRILGEFYQLLFHLSSLGVHAVDSAYEEYKNPWWNSYRYIQAGASHLLSTFIPIINLYLLLTVPITLPGNIPPDYLPTIVWSSLALISTCLIGFCLFRFKAWLWLWSVPPSLLCIGIIGLIVSSRMRIFLPLPTLGYCQIMAFEWCAIAAVIMFFLMKEYGRHHPYAGGVSIVVGVFLAGVIINLLLYAPDSHQGITDAAFKTVEIIYIMLGLGWFAFFALQFLAALLGCVAVWQIKATQPKEGRERAARAAWTARLTLAIPAALFIAVTLMLIGALDKVGSRLLPQENFYTPQFIPQFFGFLLPNYSKTSFSGPAFIHQLIIDAASPAFVIVILCLLLTVVIGFWSFFPVAWTEIFHPKSESQSSERFGKWLTNGLELIDFWGNFFVFFIAAGFPLFNLYCFLYPEAVAKFNLTEEILGMSATVLVASTTTLIAFRGRLNKLLLGFRSFLDVVLDVDNYLRLLPEDDNPSARIYSRYVSVLRYLCNWKDPQDNRGYDAILIVAHSQGTVITADLLRFLKRQTDPALARLVNGELPIYFFTMGCPLRQLYGLGFPHLYNWARHYDKTPWTLKPHDPQFIGEEQKPNPKDLLGVSRWVNTFRSGDYIGRYLWRGECCDYQWFIPAKRGEDDVTWTSDRDRPVHISEDEHRTRREFCLGAGAHTRYWDGTSDEVAAEIDILISEACETLKKRTSTVLSSLESE